MPAASGLLRRLGESGVHGTGPWTVTAPAARLPSLSTLAWRPQHTAARGPCSSWLLDPSTPCIKARPVPSWTWGGQLPSGGSSVLAFFLPSPTSAPLRDSCFSSKTLHLLLQGFPTSLRGQLLALRHALPGLPPGPLSGTSPCFLLPRSPRSCTYLLVSYLPLPRGHDIYY